MPGTFGVKLDARFTERSDGSGGIVQIVLSYHGRHPIDAKVRSMIGKPSDDEVYRNARQLILEHAPIQEYGRQAPIALISQEMKRDDYHSLIHKLKGVRGLSVNDGYKADNGFIDSMIARTTPLGDNHSSITQ